MRRDSQDSVPTVLALDQISGIMSSLNSFAYVMFRGMIRLLLYSGMTVTKESVSVTTEHHELVRRVIGPPTHSHKELLHRSAKK